ncbi:MAG: hypothetical protein JXR76_24075 [Deltaproteobacteria bacterium]|nr:hypothetical protein [Deltaproteobacteria bacterium]
MKTQFTLFASVLMISICICLVGCQEEDNDSDSTNGNNSSDTTARDDINWNEFGPYAVISLVGESYFLGVVDSLSIGAFTQSKSVETDGIYTSVYKNRIYVMPVYYSGGTKIHVYTVGSDNTLSMFGTIPVPANSGPGGILFVDSQTAYVPLTIDGRILKFNPSTLSITGEIDLRPYAVGSSKTSNDDNSPEPTSLVVRDGKLYAALGQSYNNMQMGRPVMQVAVVNMETNTVDKIISDSTSGLSMPGSMVNEGGFMFEDENGDLYLLGSGSWGWVEGQSAGFLRINAGETKFDPSWKLDFSDLSLTVTGGVIDYLHFATYAGNGIVYGSAHVPADESDPVDWVNDRCYTHVKIDVWNNTVEVLPLPPTGAYGSDLTTDSGYLIAPMYTDAGSGIYVYNPVTNQIVGDLIVRSEGSIGSIRHMD